MKKISIFLITTFILTWAIAFGLMFNGGYKNPYALTIVAGCMFMPAIATIITTLITKEKFKDVWIKPNIKGNIKYYLIGWLAPVVLVLFGAAVYFILFPSHFDGNMTTMINAAKDQLTALGQAVPSDSQLKTLLMVQLVSAIFIAPVLNFIPCLGEELGWRGYLLPNLLKETSPVKATLISGLIWGVWHAPMIAMGHNYGLNYKFAPWGGILAMIIFCVILGSLLSYITIKSKSCIPAAIGHAMVNGFSATGIMFLAINNPNPFVGPAPISIVVGIGFVITAVFCLKLIAKSSFESKTKSIIYDSNSIK